jgi:MinD-like ATPase involved in chromosome partitioning or flagellar assembly/FixJ family two-component response regulator
MIFTFYSYKGGVGRTMALANIAEFWYSRGGSVLMIDWDLESPGLEMYFPHISQSAKRHRGLLDMLLSYKDYVSTNLPPEDSDELPFEKISNFTIDVYAPSEDNQGVLRLLSTGRRDGENFAQYANDVRMFDWGDFYENWAGEQYFEWFRREIENLAPIILIDSRSGVSEMSGVCTYQLADVVVAFTSSNKQSIEGTVEMIDHLKSDRLQELRPNRSKLDAIVVPSRVEQTELIERNKFEKTFKREFDTLLPLNWRKDGRSLWNLSIPYVPLYAFEELVAVREERLNGERTASELVSAYRELWDAMVDSVSPPGEEPWRWREQGSDILVVEAVSSWQRLLERIITTRVGRSCDVVTTREDALSKLEKREYHLVVLNLNLSSQSYGMGYEGLDILDFLKATGRKIPVLILTDEPGISTGNIYRRYQDNVMDIMFKGLKDKNIFEKLTNVIRDLLERKNDSHNPEPRSESLSDRVASSEDFTPSKAR